MRTGRAHRAGGRRLGAVVAAILLGWSGAAGVTRAAADEWTVRTGVHVDAWSGAGQSGRQVLLPWSLGFDTPTWGVSGRGALGHSERDPGGGAETGSMTGLVDTTLSGYYRLRVAGAEVKLGLDLDLPTGDATGVARLPTRDLAAVQDEDLVTVERFGEGFDVNPTVTAYRSFGAFGLGLGLGYHRTGKYDPTRDAAHDDLDPGDELTVVALGDVYATDTIRLMALVAYTRFTADERGGRELFREGDELDLRVSVEWRPEPWWAAVAVRDVVRFKAERPDAGGGLVTEARNSHGNDIRVGATVGYVLDDAWSLQAAVDLRHVAANDYAAGDPLRDGGRTKVAVGPSVTWTPHRTFAVDAGLRYFLMDVKQGPAFPRSGTIHGVHADVRVTYRF